MTKEVLNELIQDYNKIINKIKIGEAHNIHQKEHNFLTICPKHSGKFKDLNCKKSKCLQPFSENYAERRAYRLKNRYINLIIKREINKIN